MKKLKKSGPNREPWGTLYDVIPATQNEVDFNLLFSVRKI